MRLDSTEIIAELPIGFNTSIDKRTVLFIDDEERILKALRRELIEEPYDALFAGSGKEALEIIEHNEVHVLVTDMRMPEMSGLELLGIVKKHHPRIIRIVLSGHAQIDIVLTAINHGEIYRFITKPWKFDGELKTTIHQAIQFYDLYSERDRLIEELQQARNQLEEKVEKRTRALRIANEQLEEHDRLKDGFIITMTHELRTPITIFKNVISNALAGAMGRISTKLKTNLEVAEEAIDRLAVIIGNLMDVSTIDAGMLRLDSTLVAIQSIVNRAVDSLSPKAESKNIELKTIMPQEQLIINVDHDKIVQALTNVIANAIKFTDVAGSITVRIKDLADEIVVEVEDNGPGISPDEMDKIFDRFMQINKQVGEGAHGTGLGLTIAKGLVEKHGGRIWVENIPTGGAKFTFVLPSFSSETRKVSKLVRT